MTVQEVLIVKRYKAAIIWVISQVYNIYRQYNGVVKVKYDLVTDQESSYTYDLMMLCLV